MNKEIEEMASVMCGTKCSCKECIKTHAYNGEWFNCILPSKAEVLYNAGFRKADTVRKETAREILRILHNIGGCDATREWDKGFDAAIDTAYKAVKERYGVEVEE